MLFNEALTYDIYVKRKKFADISEETNLKLCCVN